ncbi:MAG: rRNA pseudouridine synthase [Clostridia bacterium]|nr:rRNA pseudouridine synthase [Clostridia bacterium]
MNLQRLDKIIASQSGISRTDAKADIRHGLVSVDGAVSRDPSVLISVENAEIIYKGQAVSYKKYIYIVMNKPKGVLSASNDKNRKTVVDLVPPELSRSGLFPVGRLDKDTTGLLLITDDGQFAHRVISPKSDIKKVYEVLLDAPIPTDAVEKFSAGVVLADGTKCLPADLKIIEPQKARVEIREGKYHQIKRMFGVLDLGVNQLKRLSVGGLTLPKELNEGECRELTESELKNVEKRFVHK